MHARHDDVIQRANVHQGQRLLEPLGQHLVGIARLRIPARMVVRNDDRRRVVPQGRLDHFSRMHLGRVDGALEHLGIVDQAMLRIEE